MTQPLRDVHTYDGHLQHARALLTSSDDAVAAVQWLHTQFHDPVAKLMLERIWSDGPESAANFDAANGLCAHHLLRILATHLRQAKEPKDLLRALEEQLVDTAQLGPCPQGRTTRLWQVLTMLL